MQWPILVAPLIPLYGLALPKHPRLRIGLQAATGAGGARALLCAACEGARRNSSGPRGGAWSHPWPAYAVRLPVPLCCAVLLYGFGWAISGSSKVTGG